MACALRCMRLLGGGRTTDGSIVCALNGNSAAAKVPFTVDQHELDQSFVFSSFHAVSVGTASAGNPFLTLVTGVRFELAKAHLFNDKLQYPAGSKVGSF